MWFALFDNQYPREVLLTNPDLYSIGLKSKFYHSFTRIDQCFSKWIFWKWVLLGALQGVLILFLVLFGLEGGTASHDQYGQPASLWESGTIIYAMVVIVANVKVAYSTNVHSIYSTIIILLSIVSFFVIFYVENTLLFINQLFGLFRHTM